MIQTGQQLDWVPSWHPTGKLWIDLSRSADFFTNTPCCDAQRAPRGSGIHQRLLLYKWTGQHWSKVYTINVINAGFRRLNVSICFRAKQCHNNHFLLKICQAIWVHVHLCVCVKASLKKNNRCFFLLFFCCEIHCDDSDDSLTYEVNEL